MGDFPSQTGMELGSTIINSTSSNTAGGDISFTAPNPAASATWPAAARIIYVPWYVERTTTVVQMYTYNGTVAAGNVDIGIYDYGRNRLTSSGATAQAGTSTIQIYNTADITMQPGTYYLALMCTLATATVFRGTINVNVLQASGIRQEAGGAALPATATFANPASSFMPFFGAVTVATL